MTAIISKTVFLAGGRTVYSAEAEEQGRGEDTKKKSLGGPFASPKRPQKKPSGSTSDVLGEEIKREEEEDGEEGP